MKRSSLSWKIGGSLALLILSVGLSTPAFAEKGQAESSVQTRKGQVKNNAKKSPKEIMLLDKAWQQKSESLLKKLAFIEQLQKDLDTQFHTLENQSRILMAQAIVLVSEETSRMAAVEFVKRAAELAPLKTNKTATAIVWKEFQKKIGINDSSNYNALAEIARALSTSGQSGNDAQWHFFLGIAAKNQGKIEDALAHLAKVEPTSPLFRHARLNEGLLNAANGQLQRARTALETVLSIDTTDAEKSSNMDNDNIVNLKEIAALNLARLMFENKEFKDALAFYRSIDSKSPLFYESLSEQGWAFFMAGHPNRALGAEYGATSPFFNSQFQPDQYFLSASVNYWLCDFAAARRNIRAFVAHTKNDAALLNKWKAAESASAEDKKLLVQKAFSIAEALVLGVSAQNSSLGPRSLQTIANKPLIVKKMKSLQMMRENRLAFQADKWPLRIKKAVMNALVKREEAEQAQVGSHVLAIIDSMRSEYDRAFNQLRLIHLEIMTAEKDKLANNDRSASGQQFLGTEAEFTESASQDPHLWSNDKREFWKDELDSFVFKKTSTCNQPEGEVSRHAEK
jgi:tetratricopeptide (TPR) repeat protein